MLGIDTIAPKGEMARLNERANALGQHAYGLDGRLFTSKQEQAEVKKNYEEALEWKDT